MFAKKAKYIVAGLSLAMALSPVAAFADGTTPAATTADITKGITKKLEVNPGSSVTAQFQYTATPTVLNKDNAATKTEDHKVTATIGNIDLTANGAEATGTAAITYGKFDHAGTYAWVVKETTDTYKGAGQMQYDTETYTLVAVVENGANGPEVKESYLIKGTATETSGDKVGTATFTNKYTEKTNDGENKPLVVKKTVDGKQGDKTKQFTFTVTFTAPDVLPVNADGTQQSKADVLNAITATPTNATITGQAEAGADATTRTFTFTAADAQSVEFNNVLVGTTYKVEETESGQAGYTTDGEVKTATVLSEDGANVTVKNTKDGTPVTGVIVNNAPFVVMIGVAVAGVAAYGAAKRKIEK